MERGRKKKIEGKVIPDETDFGNIICIENDMLICAKIVLFETLYQFSTPKDTNYTFAIGVLVTSEDTTEPCFKNPYKY